MGKSLIKSNSLSNSSFKKSSVHWDTFLFAEVQKLEAQYISDPTSANRNAWKEVLYKQLILDKAEQNSFLALSHYYEEGENAGHLLTVIANCHSPTNYITFILIPAGVPSFDILT